MTINLPEPGACWTEHIKRFENESSVKEEQVVLNCRTMTTSTLAGNLTTSIVLTFVLARGMDNFKDVLSSYPDELNKVVAHLLSPEICSCLHFGLVQEVKLKLAYTRLKALTAIKQSVMVRTYLVEYIFASSEGDCLSKTWWSTPPWHW